MPRPGSIVSQCMAGKAALINLLPARGVTRHGRGRHGWRRRRRFGLSGASQTTEGRHT